MAVCGELKCILTQPAKATKVFRSLEKSSARGTKRGGNQLEVFVNLCLQDQLNDCYDGLSSTISCPIPKDELSMT